MGGLLLLTGCTAPDATPHASHIFSGGTILTLTAEHPDPAALAIGDGRILAIGSAREMERFRGPRTVQVELAGSVLAPAFVDHHVHLLNLGLSLLYAVDPPPSFVDIAAGPTLPEITDALSRRASALPVGSWILGKGWSQGAWGTGVLPTHQLLSLAAPEHPVFLTRVDAHAGWVNAEAMRLAGISAVTADPPGGAIVRLDDADPSGVLLERANELLRPLLPETGDQEIKRAFRLAAEALFAQGVTEVFDAGFLGPPGVVDLELDLERYLALLVEADRESPLPLRVNLMIPAPSKLAARLTARRGALLELSPRLGISHLKLFVDGALGSRGALLTHPYADDPGTTGVDRMSHQELRDSTLEALAAGLDVATHAIGNAAVARALDVYQEILASSPDLPPARLRIEHFSYAEPEDLQRAADLGIVVSVNPDFVAPDDHGMAMEDARVGPEASARVYAFGTLARAGAQLAFGSDYFAAPLPALAGFYSAVTRRNAGGMPAEGWHPPEILERETALAVATSLLPPGGAGRQRGVLEVGGAADLMILSADPLAVDPSEILDIRVDATYSSTVGSHAALR